MVSLYGSDYDTLDGTCVRDYIHVQDLCDAHVLALGKLIDTGKSDQFNLGNGKGFSVRQVIDCAREITGQEIPAQVEARRQGDPAILVADANKATRELGWAPQLSSLEKIVESAWNWERSFFSRHCRTRVDKIR